MSLGEDATASAFLYDLVVAGQNQLPASGMVTAFGILIVGMIAGLEGSGFSGLPLTGSLAGSLAEGSGVSSPTLAAIGQMGNIWSGGGTLVAWSSLLAVAGFVRVPAVELAGGVSSPSWPAWSWRPSSRWSSSADPPPSHSSPGPRQAGRGCCVQGGRVSRRCSDGAGRC